MRAEYIHIEYLLNCLMLLLKYNKMIWDRVLLSRKESNQAYLMSIILLFGGSREESQNLSNLWLPTDTDYHLEMLLEPGISPVQTFT